MKNHFKYPILLFLVFISCNDQENKIENKEPLYYENKNIKYGFDFNKFIVNEKKIKRGDTFGSILESNGIDYPEVHNILQNIKNQVSVKKLNIGKKYFILFSDDSIRRPEYFIYANDITSFLYIKLKDSIYGKKVNKPIKIRELDARGVIESSLYETMISNGYNEQLSYYLSDIYAWTIDFFRLQKGDRFKILYQEKFVDDTISIGISKILAASFEHKGKIIEAYEFKVDSVKGITDYFDDDAKNLRRAFLKAPVSFGRVSSRYNLKRKISFYGRVKPHKGTDFAAAVGTPIMTTADGRVVKSSYSKGNGNYVTVKHNNTYSTQYLHMRRRKVKVGQYVKQGDVIGWVGMTGFTSGPHVCYRFWKNGIQVDPFKQKLPEAKPISSKLKSIFLDYKIPLKERLNCITFN
ncbi:MAG: peptidoglycan DD-metalloendopeptidase family protein [Bacteroidota bacterium]|nr:peptidoglycan DD-metalloendopeptidase family protein [Bacteroidota bacterium]